MEAAFPLTDTRVLSVVFVSPDGTRATPAAAAHFAGSGLQAADRDSPPAGKRPRTRATQLMESYGYYLYESLPYINLDDGFMYERISDLGEIRLNDHSRYVSSAQINHIPCLGCSSIP